MSKLQFGTKVKIKENLVVDEFYNGVRFHSGMSKHIGKTTTIADIPHYNKSVFKVDIDLEGYDWTAGMFEVVS